MKPLLLVVEDNPDLRDNIQLVLELNDYSVVTACTGKDALKKLAKMDRLPDIIICDIMMPEMNGYDLFKMLSGHPIWCYIPFIFLTARTEPHDVRFAKMLGIDDYIKKPYEEEDLLASVKGSLVRNKIVRKRIEQQLSKSSKEIYSTSMDDSASSFVILLMYWDSQKGPYIDSIYTRGEEVGYDIEEIGIQLLTSTMSVYGEKGIESTQELLLSITNIQSMGYLYFDYLPLKDGDRKPLMLAMIAPKISYFDSRQVRTLFTEIIEKIKNNQDWNIEEYGQSIISLLSTKPYNPLEKKESS